MHKVTINAKTSNERNPWDANGNAWTVQVRYRGRQLTVPFYTGSLAGEPTADDVASCIISDAFAGEQSFEDFCSDFEYDTDSRQAWATWNACRKMAPRVRRLFGADLEQVMESVQ